MNIHGVTVVERVGASWLGRIDRSDPAHQALRCLLCEQDDAPFDDTLPPLMGWIVSADGHWLHFSEESDARLFFSQDAPGFIKPWCGLSPLC